MKGRFSNRYLAGIRTVARAASRNFVGASHIRSAPPARKSYPNC